MSITITFTEQQFQALKNILNNAEPDEARWVEEHYDYEEKLSDGPVEVLQRLDELDVEPQCTYRYIQQVRVAMRTVVWKNLNEKKVEEAVEEEDTITEKQFFKLMDRQGQTWKDLCTMLFNRMPNDELVELTEEWKEEGVDESCPGDEDDYEYEECCDTGCKFNGHWTKKVEEDEDVEEEKWRARMYGSSVVEKVEEDKDEDEENLCDRCNILLEGEENNDGEGFDVGGRCLCYFCADRELTCK